jgi:hypothetical protein
MYLVLKRGVADAPPLYGLVSKGYGEQERIYLGPLKRNEGRSPSQRGLKKMPRIDLNQTKWGKRQLYSL